WRVDPETGKTRATKVTGGPPLDVAVSNGLAAVTYGPVPVGLELIDTASGASEWTFRLPGADGAPAPVAAGAGARRRGGPRRGGGLGVRGRDRRARHTSAGRLRHAGIDPTGADPRGPELRLLLHARLGVVQRRGGRQGRRVARQGYRAGPETRRFQAEARRSDH